LTHLCIRFAVVADGATEDYFRASRVPAFQAMWTKIHADPDSLVATVQEGIGRVLDATGQWAFVSESAPLSYAARRRCDLALIDFPVERYLSLAVPLGFPFTSQLNVTLQQLLEENYVYQLGIKWWHERVGNASCDDDARRFLRPPNVGFH